MKNLKEWHKDFNKSLQKFPEEIYGFASAIQIKNLSHTISCDAVFDVAAIFCGLLLRQNNSRNAINLAFRLQIVQDSVYTFDLIHLTCQMHWSLSMATYGKTYGKKSFTMVSAKMNIHRSLAKLFVRSYFDSIEFLVAICAFLTY